MIRLLCIEAIGLGATMRPPFGARANSSTARSTSAALLTGAGMTSTPNEDADALSVRRNPGHAGCPASDMNMTRRVRGAISLSASSHFPAKAISKCVNPVIFAPGLDIRHHAELDWTTGAFFGLVGLPVGQRLKG